MNEVYELMVHPHGKRFACALDGANPELAEIAEIHQARRAAAPPDATDHAVHPRKVDRKLAGLVLAICAAIVMVIGSRWGSA